MRELKGATVARRLEGIPFAGIRKVFEKANRLAAIGIKVIHFEIGRPDFDTPLHIKEAAKNALDNGLVHYAPNAGLPALREAIARVIAQNKGVSYDPESEIIVTAGGQEAMFLTLQTLLDPGDEVLVPDPGFGQFFSGVRLAGGTPVGVPLLPEQNSHFDLAAAERAVTERTKAIIVNSPHNPTGGVLSREQMEEVVNFARAHNLVLLSDEAYDHMLYEGRTHWTPAAFPGMRERTVVCGSLSKTYAMTGWRIGYIAAPREFVEATVRMQQNVMLSVCTFAQVGATAALNGPQDCVAEMMTEFSRRRNLMLKYFEQVPGLKVETFPGGAFYIFARLNLPGVSSAQLADYLLDKAGVAVVDGASFGRRGEGYLRFSYAVSFEDCREGMERVARAMENLAHEKANLR